tara:strand:- start:276 stop:518 length:243 start_codon:yes stop_codon:yes gene_type:complete
MFIQDFEHSPESYSITIVPIGILLNIGIRGAGPWIAYPLIFREVFVMFDVRRNPESYPCVVRPFDYRSIHYGQVVDPVWG